MAPQGVVGLGGRLLEREVSTPADRWRSIFMKQHWGETRCTPPYLFGSNTVFLRQAIVDVGMYDVSLRSNYEDVDLCTRLKRKGHIYRYHPDAVVFHNKRDTVSSALRSYWRWQMPPKERRQRFSSIDGLREQLHYNRAYASIDLLKAAETADQELVYITSLLFFSHSLLDIRAFVERIPPEQAAGGDPYEQLSRLEAIRTELIELLKSNARQISDIPTISTDLGHTIFDSSLIDRVAGVPTELFDSFLSDLRLVARQMSSQISDVCNRARVHFGKALWVHSA